MSLYVRHGGEIRSVRQVFARKSGAVEELTGIYRRVNEAVGVRRVFQALEITGLPAAEVFHICSGGGCALTHDFVQEDIWKIEGGSDQPKGRSWAYVSGWTGMIYVPGPTPAESYFSGTVDRGETKTTIWRLTATDGPVVRTLDVEIEFEYFWIPP